MKNRKKLTFMLLIIALVLMPLAILGYAPSQAADVKYPTPCYEGDELKKVREWEKTFVGKRIDSTNIEGVKDFVPENYYEIIKNPKKWGEIWFEIVPYRQIKPTKGQLEATLKYAGKVKIGQNDELLGWVHGIPFLEPKTALEIAYNFDSLNRGDTQFNVMTALAVDGVRRYDRNIKMETHKMYFSGRTDVPPIPETQPNSKQIRRANHVEWFVPQLLRGDRNLQIKWKDDLKDWGLWSFSAATRRLVRRNSSFRWDHQGGSDMCMDDLDIYDYAVSAMTYKHTGRKEVLLARHADPVAQFNNHVEGYNFDNGILRERLKVYVIEAVHKNPKYLYSKQVWYIDPETWYILYADKYDRQGELWKIAEMGQALYELISTGEKIPFSAYNSYCDVQRMHSTTAVTPVLQLGATGDKFKPVFYQPRALLRHGY